MILTTDLEQVVSPYLKQNYEDFERPISQKNHALEKVACNHHSGLFLLKGLNNILFDDDIKHPF